MHICLLISELCFRPAQILSLRLCPGQDVAAEPNAVLILYVCSNRIRISFRNISEAPDHLCPCICHVIGASGGHLRGRVGLGNLIASRTRSHASRLLATPFAPPPVTLALPKRFESVGPFTRRSPAILRKHQPCHALRIGRRKLGVDANLAAEAIIAKGIDSSVGANDGISGIAWTASDRSDRSVWLR